MRRSRNTFARKNRQRRIPRLERLSQRQMMAADIALNGSTLEITFDDASNYATIRPASDFHVPEEIRDTLNPVHVAELDALYSEDPDTVVLTILKSDFEFHAGKVIFSSLPHDPNSPGQPSSGPLSETFEFYVFEDVDEIEINGGAGDDVIANQTDKPSTIFGGPGADKIFGGLADDELHAGSSPTDFALENGHADAASILIPTQPLVEVHGVDVVFGGGGNDALIGGSGTQYLIGGTGHDTHHGGAGSDVLIGGYGNDDLYGQSGGDIIYGGMGQDYHEGGSGGDAIYGEETGAKSNALLRSFGVGPFALTPFWIYATDQSPSEAHPSPEGDSLESPDEWEEYRNGREWFINDFVADMPDWFEDQWVANVVFAGSGNDYVIGASGTDVVLGSTGDDILRGGDGRDYINGEAGSDSLRGGYGVDFLYAGTNQFNPANHPELDLNNPSSTDILLLSELTDSIQGGPGDDWIVGSSNVDAIAGESGGDRINAGGGDDWVWGSSPFFSGDDMQPGNLHDIIDGQAGDDTLFGSVLDDQINGGVGDDVIYGLGGDDRIWPGQGVDFADGGQGDDYINDPANGEIRGGPGNDEIWVGSNVMAYGESGNDDLVSDSNLDASGHNILDGGEGMDYLASGGEFDTLIGGDDSDWLVGNGNSTTLTGGAGDDHLAAWPGDIRTDDNELLLSGYQDWLDARDANGGFYDSLSFGRSLITTDQSPVLPVIASVRDGVLQIAATDANQMIVVKQDGNQIMVLRREADGRLTALRSFESIRSLEIHTGDGNDVIVNQTNLPSIIRSGGGNDRIRGGRNVDRIFADPGNDWLQGGGGNVVLDGGDGRDTIRGGDGNDRLFGGLGLDFLYGDNGNDYLDGGADGERDQVTGGAGFDRAVQESRMTFIKGRLSYESANDETQFNDKIEWRYVRESSMKFKVTHDAKRKLGSKF
ncbi:MAG: calcium-binding protein [Planctomycetota bacterium]